MKKTLYSLMLNEEVVREIDRMAHRMGTNRSALINQILADYTSVMTPERRIESIFHEIEQLVAPARDLVPFFAPHTTSMSLKSSLEYKYRPTVKYEVALYGDKQEGLGELAVIFRTQSAALLQSMTQFFRLWKQIEDAHLSGVAPEYALYDGKFVRTLSLPPDHDYTSEEIARAISDYVQLFDRLMKAYLAGTLDEVGAVLFECVIGVLGVVARDGAGLDLFELRRKARLRDAVGAEDALDVGSLVGEDAEHQVLDGDIGVAAVFGLALGEIEDLARLGRGVHLAAAAGYLRQPVNGGVELAEHGVAVHAHAAEQGADQAAVGVDERIEQVLRREILVAVFLRHALRGLDGFNCLLCEFISVHSRVAACSGTQRLLS